MKKIFLMLGMVAWAGFAQAAFVCWTTADTTFEYTLSQLVCVSADAAGALTLVDDEGYTALFAAKGMGEAYAELPSGVAADTQFRVVLLDSAQVPVAESMIVTYEELAQAGSVYTSILYTPDPKAYAFGGFTKAIPEPTSGLLLLCGLAALGLKRKVI